MAEVALGIDVRQHALDLFRRKRMFSIGVPLAVLSRYQTGRAVISAMTIQRLISRS